MKRLSRVRAICAPLDEERKERIIWDLTTQLIYCVFDEIFIPKHLVNKSTYVDNVGFIARDIPGIVNGKPESEENFLKRKLIYEAKRNLN